MQYLNGNARISTLLTAALAGAIFLAACGQPAQSSSSSQPEKRYSHETTTTTEYVPPTTMPVTPPTVSRSAALNELYSNIPSLDFGADDQVWELLGTVCGDLDDTNGDFAQTGQDIVDASAGTFDLTYSDAGVLVAVAVMSVCPRWQDAAKSFAGIS